MEYIYDISEQDLEVFEHFSEQRPLGKLVIMTRSKIIINISVIALAFILFVIWHQSSIKRANQTSASLIRYYKVYLITTDKEAKYWEFINEGASDLANAIGINYIWDAPVERDVDLQIEVIKKAIENGANALLVAADDPKLISGVVEDAKARGVKVIYVDSPAYEEAITTLATNNYEAGVAAGKAMISTLNEMGINSGSIGIVSVEGKENTNLREMGFRDTLAPDERFTILNTIYTSGEAEDARVAAEKLISENQDLVALLGTSLRTSMGVGAAIKANDNRYVGIGFDKTDITLQLLREGSLKVIIDQNPYTMGYLGMAQAVAAILGKDTGPSYIDTGISILDQ